MASPKAAALCGHSSVYFLGCGEAFWSRTVGCVQLGEGMGLILPGPFELSLVRSPLLQEALLVALSSLHKDIQQVPEEADEDPHHGYPLRALSKLTVAPLLLFLLRLVLSGNSQGKSTPGEVS